MKKALILFLLVFIFVSIPIFGNQSQGVFKPEFKEELEEIYQEYCQIKFPKQTESEVLFFRDKDSFKFLVDKINEEYQDYLGKKLEKKNKTLGERKLYELSRFNFMFDFEVFPPISLNVLPNFNRWYLDTEEMSPLIGAILEVNLNIYDHTTLSGGFTLGEAHKNKIKEFIGSIPNIELTKDGIFFNIDYQITGKQKDFESVLRYLQVQYLKQSSRDFPYKIEGKNKSMLNLLDRIRSIPLNVSFAYFADPESQFCKSNDCSEMQTLLIVDNIPYGIKDSAPLEEGIERIKKESKKYSEKDKVIEKVIPREVGKLEDQIYEAREKKKLLKQAIEELVDDERADLTVCLALIEKEKEILLKEKQISTLYECIDHARVNLNTDFLLEKYDERILDWRSAEQRTEKQMNELYLTRKRISDEDFSLWKDIFVECVFYECGMREECENGYRSLFIVNNKEGLRLVQRLDVSVDISEIYKSFLSKYKFCADTKIVDVLESVGVDF